jgi:hypothetical protein
MYWLKYLAKFSVANDVTKCGIKVIETRLILVADGPTQLFCKSNVITAVAILVGIYGKRLEEEQYRLPSV